MDQKTQRSRSIVLRLVGYKLERSIPAYYGSNRGRNKVVGSSGGGIGSRMVGVCNTGEGRCLRHGRGQR